MAMLASMRKLDKVLEYMEEFPSEEMLAFFRATRHFQLWDTIRMKVATDAAKPKATDVLKFFSETFAMTVSGDFTNLHKELTAENKAAEKKEGTTEKMAEDTAEEKYMGKLYPVMGSMDEFSSEEMMAFFRATRHFQMWDTMRMKVATDAAKPEATDVLKYFSATFVKTVSDEFTKLHKEPTAEDKAAEKKEETTEKTAEDTAEEKKEEKKEQKKEQKEEKEEKKEQKEEKEEKSYLDMINPRQAARLVKVCKQNNPNFKDPRDEAPSPKRQATGSSSPKAE